MSARIAFFGYGRFGRALSALLLESGADVRAFDTVASIPSGLRAATPAELVAGAEVVILAVPVPVMKDALLAMRPHLSPSQLVLDVGSVKLHPVEAMREVLGSAIPWIGTHPLFGPTSLALGERPLRVVICPNPLHPDAFGRARALFEGIGCQVIEQAAEVHDREMAETHAMAFFIAKGMLDAGVGQNVSHTPPSFQAIARTIEVVRSDAGHLFTAIQRENPFAPAARQRLIAALSSVDRALLEGGGSATAGSASSAAAIAAEQASLEIPDLGSQSPELRETRELIDELDRELVSLLSRRAQLSLRAGRTKATLGKAVRDPARESKLLEARKAWAQDLGLDAPAVAEIFESILRFSRSLQEREP